MAEGSSAPNVTCRLLFLDSLTAFVFAFLLGTLLHEGAHALTARAVGLRPVLHHNYVSYLSTAASEAFSARLAVPAAGPLVSLLQGVVCLLLSRRFAARSVGSLVLLWLGLLGFITFCGYLMMGPVFAYGDTGKVFALLGLPGWVQWLLAAGGLAALVFVVRGSARDFERQAIPLAVDGREPASTANCLVAFPLLAGVFVNTLLSLPVPTFLSLLYPLTSPFAVFMAYGRMRRSPSEAAAAARHSVGATRVLIAITVGLALLSRWLVPGRAL